MADRNDDYYESRSSDMVPSPDPTRLTTQLVDRALAAQREYMLAQIAIVEAVAKEKFDAITTQFTERDTRTEQAAQESRISLDAALAAAKEAVSEQNKANTLAIGKSEDATKERLDSLATLGQTTTAALQAQVNDLKGRLDRGEGRVGGAEANHVQTREDKVASNSTLFGIVMAMVGIGGIVLTLSHLVLK